MQGIALVLRLFGATVCFVGVFIQLALLQNSDAIIGGIDAHPGEFPFIVSLRNHTGLHYCGGALITRRHVLTAAHCLFSDETVFGGIGQIRLSPRNVTVAINSVAINPRDDKIYRVKKLVPHGNYRVGVRYAYNYDIAIITLMEEITDPEVRPIKLATSYPMRGQEAIIAGWGIHEKIHKLTLTSDVNRLKKLGVLIYAPVECVMLLEPYNIIEPNIVRSIISLLARRKIFCAMNDVTTGVCYRDSGGPLIANDELVGIVSFGIPCAQGFPDMYTAVSNYRSFINGQIEEYWWK